MRIVVAKNLSLEAGSEISVGPAGAVVRGVNFGASGSLIISK